MSNSSSSSSSLGSTGIAFGLGMALVGLVLGYMIGSGKDDGPSSDELSAEIDKAVDARLSAAKDADAKKAVGTVSNKTGGDLRRLSEKEKAAMLSKKSRPQDEAPVPPANSPFLTDLIKGTFGDDSAALDQYINAVALMAQGNARKARPTLTALHAKAGGKKWSEQVTVLLADARVSVGEVAEGRQMLTEWRSTYPMSDHTALAMVAEGKAAMKDGKRITATKGTVAPAQRRAYEDAIALFDKAISGWPADPALEQAYLNKASLMGELGDMDGAEAAATTLATTFPTAKQAPRGVFNVARIAFDNGDYPRAERLYKRLVTDFPGDRLSKTARGNLSALELLGKPAPDMDISEWIGDDLGSIASMKGKPVLLLFWATWCPHCRKAMPGIEENVWQKYQDKGLQVVAVTKNSRGQTSDKVREYLTENGYTMPVAIDPGTTSRNYGVSGIPAAALVDKEGNVVFRNHPSQVTDELIQKYL